MFIYHSKYYSWYTNLITKAQSADRIKGQDVYYESHHVIPVSLAGNDDNDNRVLLTAREHYIAHLLLTKCTEGQAKHSMIRAAFMMSKTRKGIKINSYLYRELKEEYSIVQSEYQTGKKYKILICPHCRKEGGGAGMKRFHFGNCILNPDLTYEQKINLIELNRTTKENEVLEWNHEEHGTYLCTRHELFSRFHADGISIVSLGTVQRKDIKSHLGWHIVLRDINNNIIEKPKLKSEKRNNTTYKWEHDEYGDFYGSIFELRDTYREQNLCNDVLNRMVRKERKSHRGWKLSSKSK